MTEMELNSPQGLTRFACPVHKSLLAQDLFCEHCDRSYPRIGGVPILINDENSVFRISDYTSHESAYGGASAYAGHLDRRSGIRQLYRKCMLWLMESEPVPREFSAVQAVGEIHESNPAAKVLVIGAGDAGFAGDVTYTDVAFGKHVTCIADAHDLPFADASFDACIACAVLEHVADPQRCVSEIVRVLSVNGFIYAETPFMQPVHMGAYDFTRFTFLGHRRLFRRFDEIRSGMAGGPATSAAQTLRHLFASLSGRSAVRKVLKAIGVLASYPLRQMDRLTRHHEASYDSASGFYFFGKLREDPIPDREIIKMYRGG